MFPRALFPDGSGAGTVVPPPAPFSVANQTLAVSEWLMRTLRAGTALCGQLGGTAAPRIYTELAPHGAVSPYLVARQLSSLDVKGANGELAGQETLWQVSAWCQGMGLGEPGTVNQMAHSLLHRQGGTVLPSTGGTVVIYCERDDTVQQATVVDGQRWNLIGGSYRIWAF